MIIIESRIAESLEIVERMFEVSRNPYLALSFGKDSLVMLDLVRKIKPGITCLFLKSEESFLMYNFEDLIKYYNDINLQIIETNRLTEHGFDWSKSRKAGNKDFYRPEFFAGYDGIFMGLRIDESKARRISLIKRENNKIGKFIMQYKAGKRKGMYRCCPVAKWSAFEILHYLKCKNLPFLDIYSEGEHIRTTARITGDAHRQNALFWIKKNKPENWNKLIKLMPELKVI